MADKGNEDDWEYDSEDGESYEWEYSEEEAADEKGDKTDKTAASPSKPVDAAKNDDNDEEEEEEEEEVELEDIDLPDPFSTEPTPKIADIKTNGTSENNGSVSEEKNSKKHRKHKNKKSKHHDKFEKFRKLEEGESKSDEQRSRKIHVRSKDPSKIARQFEKGAKEKDRGHRQKKGAVPGKEQPRPKPIEINQICKICGKEPYLVERLVAEKSWWHKNCFRCHNCNKILNLDTYASHQGVIYCKPHHKELFQPKPVVMDLTEEIIKKNIDFSQDDPIERHRNQERRMETIVRENRPVQLEGVIKSKVDDSKWDGLEKLDVGSKFLMFEKSGAEEKEQKTASDRYGIMEKLKRLQAGEDVEDLLAEIDEEMPSMSEDEEEEDADTAGLTQVQKKAQNAEKLFIEESRKEKLMNQRKKELKGLRDRLMAGTRDSILDSFDELNHKKIKKTQVDVRSQNAKKFMDMFNKGEIPEGISATDRITLEKEAELDFMRSKKREERNFFQKMENGELEVKGPKEPKLLIGKLKENRSSDNADGFAGDLDTAPLAKKFSFFENFDDTNNNEQKGEVEKSNERQHAARDCKARSVLSKFKDMERKVANGEEVDDPLLMHKRPLKRFTPPRKLGEQSDSEYSSSEYSDSEYSSSYSSYSTDDEEEDEYLRNIREAARAKQLMAKFEDWEAKVGEDGGYTNLVDENGLPLETASKLKNKFEQLAVEDTEERQTKPKFQVRRFKPKEAYEYQLP